jgi:hypothetical protein
MYPPKWLICDLDKTIHELYRLCMDLGARIVNSLTQLKKSMTTSVFDWSSVYYNISHHGTCEVSPKSISIAQYITANILTRV